MTDNDNILHIPQKIFKKIGLRNNTPDSDSVDSNSNMDSSSELYDSQLREQAFQNDPRFRKYVQLVEKNLQSFDAVNEWADIISFLGRLLKSFQAYPQFPVIPRRQLVAKRLAQCLNPGFPAGVHQKTLEVYAFILKTIGADQLVEDLPLWSIGIFPFVQFAATHVKPQLLALFEQYYIPLRGRLRPALRGLIIALLPALEEEGSDCFDKVVALLDKLSETVELPFFYSCMWLVMINNPTLRIPSLNFLLRKLPKIVDKEAVALVLGEKENVSLMVRAFSITLEDNQILVQRGILELLVQNFQLKHKMIPHEDQVILMRSAFGIVLRKDMSLNRRLYAWLLGTEGSTQAQVTYFSMYAERSATQAVRGMLMQEAISETQQRPYKILISLMDKWELGQPIVNNIFIDSLNSLRIRGTNPEIMQSANMWMEMVEPYLIFMKLFELLDTSFPGDQKTLNKSNMTHLDNMRLVEFTVQSFKLTDDEIRHVHFPMILAALSKKLQESLKSPSFIELLPQVSECISLMTLLLDQLPESMFMNRSSPSLDDQKERKLFRPDSNVLDYIREYYGIGQPQYISKDDIDKDRDSDDDEGDLSSSSNIKNFQDIHQQQQQRPEFEIIKGQVLVKEIGKNLISFIIDFVNSYIVLPENLQSGVDVGAEGKHLKHIEDRLERILQGACGILIKTAAHADASLKLKQESQLTTVLLKCCQHVKIFGVVDAGLSTLTQLVKTDRFIEKSFLSRQNHIKAIMDKLWGFLSPSMPLIHIRIVELIWKLTEVVHKHQIETILSNYLIVQDNYAERSMNYEKFGILWQLSEHMPDSSTTFSRPMFLMLDLLKDGSSPVDRRAGESWIRCHLKNYVRLLEPFISNICSKNIMKQPAQYNVKWKYQTLKKKQEKMTSIDYSIYLKPFDTDIIDYMFSTLITLINFGGLNILKAFKSHNVDKDTTSAKFIQSFLGVDSLPQMSFLDAIVMIAIRFLETEPNKTASATSTASIQIIQIHVADLLYLIISKLDYVNMKLVQLIQTSALYKLLYCIHVHNLELQQKLLHLIHATLAISSATAQQKEKGHRRGSSIDSSVDNESISGINVSKNDAILLMQASSDILVKCAIDALSLPENRSLLQHWMDFLLAALPYLKHAFRQMIIPLIMCVCHQISEKSQSTAIVIHENPTACFSYAENDMMIFLTGLEKLLMFGLTERVLNDDWMSHNSDDFPIPSMPDTSGLVLLGQVLHGEEHGRYEKPRDILLYHLPSILQILVHVWKVFRKPQWDDKVIQSMGDAKVNAILLGFSRVSEEVKGKLDVMFEKLLKQSTPDFVEGLTEIFFMENPMFLEYEQQVQSNMVILDILINTPSSSPQLIISTLLESIRQRTVGSYQSKRRKILRQGKLTDTSILRFAEILCEQMNKPDSIVLLWPIIHSFAKDYLSQANAYKIFLPGLMRFLTVALEELGKSDTYDQDRRMRKDAQELYQRCIDYCILIAGKSFDQSLWMRRAAVYDDANPDDSSSVHTADSVDPQPSSDIVRNVSVGNVSDIEKKASWKSREDIMINQINQYLSNRVIPNLRQLIGDNDKINSVLNNLVYYVIGPSLKSKSKNLILLNQLCEMARMPFTYKTWRKEVWDVFLDNRFFYMGSTTVKKWSYIIHVALSIEKERISELLGRITTSPSSTFFSNKELETLNRSLSLRRLSFVILSGAMDQYVPQLPVIQEKIVDLLKLDHGEMIHTDIYLFLRILLVRISQKHLMNFWPVLITELMRLFNSFIYDDFQDRPEEAQIALAGCKFLDLLCTLELDTFQIYQWIFIRDTVETLIKPRNEGPLPIMDLLSEKISSQTMVKSWTVMGV
ncbi:Dopey, N-terminal-domain-containing protein [Pilobolus umbonatus]|nr:Dopey, N-terminal-domain-containing protein [Pilobolus umbonatus]